MTYQEYLKSDEWKNRVKKRMEIDHCVCQMCGSSGTMSNPLECHHLTYRNIGREDEYKDLVILCHNCHTQVHNMMSRIVTPEGQHGFQNSQIPRITIFNLSGTEIEKRKECLENAKRNQ